MMKVINGGYYKLEEIHIHWISETSDATFQ